MDNSQGMVDKFNEKAKELNYKNVKAIKHNINEQDLPKNEYDVIATSMTLHHIKDTNMFIRKCKESLKIGGYLCINDLENEDGTFHKKHNNDGVEHFGFDIKDQLQPDIYALTIYPLNDTSLINGSNKKKRFKAYGKNGRLKKIEIGTAISADMPAVQIGGINARLTEEQVEAIICERFEVMDTLVKSLEISDIKSVVITGASVSTV